jgi:hypothetical protein
MEYEIAPDDTLRLYPSIASSPRISGFDKPQINVYP